MRLSYVLLIALLACQWEMHGQPALVHRMEQPVVAGNGVRISLSGRASGAFNRHFDLYPLEISRDLKAWELITLVTRTNSGTTSAGFVIDSAAVESGAFFRTPSNNFVTPLPPLTGPYPVGTFSRLLTDPTRTNQVRRTNHQFMVTFWYPTDRVGGRRPVPYVDGALAPSLSSFYNGIPVNSAFYGHALTNSALLRPENKWPVLLYSPSANSHRRENVFLVEELASHGFVVLGVDHRETFNSVFPDGKLVQGQVLNVNAVTQKVFDDALKDRVADVRRVLDELDLLNAEGVWQGALDLEKIGALGFSLGGATAAQLCKTEPRVKAGAGFDGIFGDPSLLTNPLTKPFLFLRADENDVALFGRPDDRRRVIEAMPRDGHFIQTIGTIHWSHSDVPLIADKASFESRFNLARHPTPPALRLVEVTSKVVLSFFKRYLTAQDDLILQNAKSLYPDMIQEQLSAP